MPFPAILLILATVLPLAACITLLLLGKRMGSPFAGYLATTFIALSFLCSGWGMLRWIGGGNYQGQPYGKTVAPINLTWKWIPIGTPAVPNGIEQDHPGFLDFDIYIDSLTLGLFVTITLTAVLVHLFAVRSLRRDPRFSRFFTCLALACFSTLALLLGGTLLQLVIFLELVGFAASLLVGFRSDRQAATRAAGRMFLVHRVGDLGLLLGLGILVGCLGNLSLPELWLMLGAAGRGATIHLAGGAIFPTGMLTVAGVALFFGAAARCAQFPLHVWSGDVADGIAPAAATVFAITLSVAGLYFIARLFPLFTPSARLLVAIVGATTLTMAALIAAVQTDVKRVLAFAAASQLGYMVLGMGVGSWVGALYHLVAYGFFQVLLFLAAGAVIRAARGQTELFSYGGLVRKMPVTAVTSAVAVLAISGVGWGDVGLSGFYSRGLILGHAGAFAALATGLGRSGAYWALFALPAAVTLLTAFYMTRWWMLTFAGEPRDRRLFDHAREVSTLFWPLVVLAIMTALAGNWLGVRDMLESSVFEARRAVQMQAETSQAYRGSAAHVFDAAWLSDQIADEEGSHNEATDALASASSAALAEGNQLVRRWVWLGFVLGILGGFLLYFRGDSTARRITRIPPVSWLHAWLYHRMYFDELYDILIVTLVLGLAGLVAWFDRNVVDGLSNLIGWLACRGRQPKAEDRSDPVDISHVA